MSNPKADMRAKAGLILLALALPMAASAQPGRWPAAVSTLELRALAGEWHEIAAFGWWWHRRCVADNHYAWTFMSMNSLEVQSSCTTLSGVERRVGRIRVSGRAPGELSARFAPTTLAWLPGVWGDYWVFGHGESPEWLLVGDRRRRSLAVLSRWAVLDEAALAAAIAIGRRQGFEVDRLIAVPQTQSRGRLTRRPNASNGT